MNKHHLLHEHPVGFVILNVDSQLICISRISAAPQSLLKQPSPLTPAPCLVLVLLRDEACCSLLLCWGASWSAYKHSSNLRVLVRLEQCVEVDKKHVLTFVIVTDKAPLWLSTSVQTEYSIRFEWIWERVIASFYKVQSIHSSVMHTVLSRYCTGHGLVISVLWMTNNQHHYEADEV